MLPAERGLVSTGACACMRVCVCMYACVRVHGACVYICVPARVSVNLPCKGSVRGVHTSVGTHMSAWCVRETDTGELGMKEEETLTFLPLLTRDPNWPPKAAPPPAPRPQPRGPAPGPEAPPAPGTGLCEVRAPRQHGHGPKVLAILEACRLPFEDPGRQVRGSLLQVSKGVSTRVWGRGALLWRLL